MCCGFAAWRGWNRPWCPRWAFSPVTAVLLGWGVLGQSLSAAQLVGMAVVVASVWLSQRAQRMAPAPATPRRAPG